MKEPHTGLFVAPTGAGKTHSALNLLESEYRNHFDFIIIICPTLAHNETYKSRGWVRTDPEVRDHSKFMRNTGPVKFDTGQTLFLRLYKRDTKFFSSYKTGQRLFF